MEKNVITYAGLRKLEDELQSRKVNLRREIAEKIKVAREQGDLSENAEYDAAKDEQRENEARIVEIEEMLKTIEVVDESEVEADKINVGSTVKVLDVEFNEEVTYYIVGQTEANSLEGKISNNSPLGAALIGHTVGETVSVEAPAGELKFKVLSISY
ncbi:MAG: transcription elongation factor GreA [Eubacterium sp.]|nr:transcription elongation factor GreA [Eubacterium sp.]